MKEIKIKRARTRRYKRWEYIGEGYDYGYIQFNSDGSIKRHWTTERARQVILSIDAEMLKGVVNN